MQDEVCLFWIKRQVTRIFMESRFGHSSSSMGSFAAMLGPYFKSVRVVTMAINQ